MKKMPKPKKDIPKKVIEFTGYKATEPMRHAAEVRHVIKLRKFSQLRANTYLDLVGKVRGNEVAQRLRDDAIEAWNQLNKRKGKV
jgi:hypothetical protein